MSSPQGPEHGQDSARRTAAAGLGGRGRVPAVSPAGPHGDASRSGDDTRPERARPPADPLPADALPADQQPGESQPANTPPGPSRPTESNRTEPNRTEPDPAGSGPSGARPAGPRPPAPGPDGPQHSGPPRTTAAAVPAAPARDGAAGEAAPTTVLPDGVRRPPPRPAVRPGSARTPSPRSTPAAESRPPAKARRARLALQRIDPWSVFLYSLVSSIFLGIALVVAVFVLYTVLDRLGVLATVNELYVELTGDDAAATPLLTSGRFVGAALVLAAVNVVLLTLLATLSALLYNLCASFTGGIEVTLGERD